MKETTQMSDQQQIKKSEAELQSEVSHVKQEVEKDLKLWAEVFSSLKHDQQRRSIFLRVLNHITDL